MTKLRFLITYLLLANCLIPSTSVTADILKVEPAKKKEWRDQRDITPLLLDENENPSEALKEILRLTGIECNSLDSCLPVTQQHWIAVLQGSGGRERTDLKEPEEYLAIKLRVLEIIAELGILNDQPPLQTHYDYAVCLGAFMDGARQRLAYLVKAWKEGVRFDQLIFLGSDRRLRNGPSEIEDFAFLCDQSRSLLPFKPNWIPPAESERVYNTENDMHKLIWEQAEIPQDMRDNLEGHVHFINALATEAGKRPSTFDTYQCWLETLDPQPGNILAASSPGIWCYQHLAGLHALDNRFQLETFAPEVKDPENLQVIVILDTLAKCLYQINVLKYE